MKKEKIVKVLSVILALMMVFSLSPMIVFADDLPGELNRGDRKEGLFTKGEEPGVGALGGDEAALYDRVQMNTLIKRSAIGANVSSENDGLHFWEDIRNPETFTHILEASKFFGGGFLKSQSEGHILHLLTYYFRYYRFDTRSNTLEEIKRFDMGNKNVVDMTSIMTDWGQIFVGLGYDQNEEKAFLFSFSPQDESLVEYQFLPGSFYFNAIAYVPKENLLYLVEGKNDKLFAMVPGGDILFEIGDLGYDSYYTYIQSMDYDEMNDTLIWVSATATESKLWTIDRNTGKAGLVGDIGDESFAVFALMPPETIHFPMVFNPSAFLNGDFENGNAGWKEETEDGSPLIIPDSWFGGNPKAHSGGNYLVFRSQTAGKQSVSQTITLPHNADLLTYWAYVIAADSEPTTPEETTIYINGEVLFLGGLRNTEEWNFVDYFSLADYAGQTVEFKFEFISDGSRDVYLFLDDFVVTTRGD